MYPDLSYLFHDLIGTRPDNWLAIFKTFGFFLAMSFLASAFFFYIELKRKANEGAYVPAQVNFIEGKPAPLSDIIINTLLGIFFVGKGGYAYHHFTEFRQDPASVLFSKNMNWPMAILGGLLFGGLIVYDNWRKRGVAVTQEIRPVFPHDRVSEITVWAAVGGITGAKLFDLFDNWEDFMADPIGSLTSGGGLAFYGGLILGFVTVVSYLRRKGIPFLPTADAFAPCVVVGYGLGRVGCQLSGDGDWGIVNNAPKPGWMSMFPDWLWSYRYPHHVLDTPNTDPVRSVPIEGCNYEYCYQLAEGVFPTPVYETMMMIVILGFLWAIRKRIKIPGMLFCIYLILSGLERFVIESIRVNVVHDLGFAKLTQAEIIALGMMLIGVVMGTWCWWRAKGDRQV
jgi:phosphatidylglycerol---prolipoprotein diacylglyceryl transferase